MTAWGVLRMQAEREAMAHLFMLVPVESARVGRLGAALSLGSGPAPGFGPIPAGLVVHHRDHNALNDVADNLQALTRAQHIEAHRSDLNRAKGLEIGQRVPVQMELAA